MSAEKDVPPVWLVHAGDEVEYSGFSSAVWAYEAHEFSLEDLHVKAIQYL